MTRDELRKAMTGAEVNRRITDKQFNIGRCIRVLRDFVLAYESDVEPEAMGAVYAEASQAIEENDKVFDPAYIPPPRVAPKEAP